MGKRLVSLVVMVALLPAAARAGQVCLYNPVGRAVYAVGTMDAAAAGVSSAEGYAAFDPVESVWYPLQVQAGRLSIAARLGPFAGKVLEIRSASPAHVGPAVSCTRRGDGSVVLENRFYRILLNAAQGYVLSEVFDKERKKAVVVASPAGLSLVRKKVRAGSAFPDAGRASQANARVGAVIEQRGPHVASVRLTWSVPEGDVTQQVTALAGSRTVEFAARVRSRAPLESVQFHLAARRFFADAVILPDQRRISATPYLLDFEPAPRKAVAYGPREKVTLGLLTAPEARGTVGVCLWDQPEAASNNLFEAVYVSRYLAYEPIGAQTDFRLGILIGGGPNALAEEAREVGDELSLQPVRGAAVTSLGLSPPWGIAGRKATLRPAVSGGARPAIRVDGAPGDGTWTPKAGASRLQLGFGQDVYHYRVETRKPVEIVSWWPQKLVLRRGEPGVGKAVVKSYLAARVQCKLALTRTAGIDEAQEVWTRSVALDPGEEKEIHVTWDDGPREYGRELRLRVAIGGEVVDARSEYTACGDGYPRYVQLTVANAGWFHLDGHQNWYIRQMRRGYTGTMEYYCWAPDHQYDLTPAVDPWEPHTESNAGAYRTTVSDAFLKKTIALAHENGLRVVAELAQFANLHNAMDHPKEVVYTEDGQPWVYNRKVYPDGAEFATVVRDYFFPDRVRAWAEEMNRSVDRFGWDGVRFDCGFLPVQRSADPLLATQASNYESYVWDGRLLRSLHPDPDATAAMLTDTWRKTTTAHRPTFRYHTNSSLTLDRQQMYPKWQAAKARDGGYVLHENLLGTNAKFDSIDGWSEQLRVHGQNVRDLGGVPAVGQVQYGPLVYNNLMEWIAFANGYHLFGAAPLRHDPGDESWKNYRFALRYCEYFYAPDLRRLPLDQIAIAVTGARGVRWRDVCYRRQFEDGRVQYLVNFINEPAGDGRLYLHFDPPPTRTNLGVTVKGAARAKAWLLVPEPEPRAVPLRLAARQADGALTIDRLDAFALLVVELGGSMSEAEKRRRLEDRR